MQTKPGRLASLDVIRGIAILIMVATHIWISFFWNDANATVTVATYLGSFISFALFLVVSGFIMGNRHRKLSFRKILGRSILLILIYIVLGALYTVLQRKDLQSLFTTPVFLEEYLLPLALFPPIAYIFAWASRKVGLFKRVLTHTVGSFFVLIGGLGLVLLGRYLGLQNTNFFLSFIVGAATYHTFPLLSYFVMYGMGMWLGWSYKVESTKNYGAEVMVTIILALITSAIAFPLERISLSLQTLDSLRWPPTLFFITAGLAIATMLVYTATLLEEKYNNIVGKTFQILGRFALQIFVIHLLFIYTVQGVVIAKVPPIATPSPTPTPTPQAAADRIYENLATTYTQKEGWPFSGYKVAVLNLDPVTMIPGTAYVELRPNEIETLATGTDITVYALTQDQAIKKLAGKVISIGNNSLIYSLNIEAGFTEIFISFSDTTLTQSLQTAQTLVTKPGKATGTKLATIGTGFPTWAYKPYSMYGQKWFVKNSKSIEGKHTFTATLPITCEELEQYQTDSNSQLTLKRDKKNIPLTSSCKSVSPHPKIPSLYAQAKSTITVPLDLDMKKEANGKKTLTYTMSLTGSSPDKEPLTFTFQKNIVVSEPLYVAWTLDWEGFYYGSLYIKDLTTLRDKVPGVRITHMFNPRLWNSPTVSKASGDAQLAFVKAGISKQKDDLGMHMHLYVDMVTKAGLNPNKEVGWSARTDGYDIPFLNYGYDDALKILEWGVNEFPKKGLAKPTSFRAGGWMMGIENLKALATAGIKIDTSGRTAFNSSNFASGGRSYPGPWKLSITTQPYWISKTDQNKSATKANSIGVYEIPNNGGDSWAFSVDALVTRFKTNFTDVPTKQKLVTYISHPDFFNKEGPKISEVLQTIYNLSADNDNGPVVFTTLHDYYQMYAK